MFDLKKYRIACDKLTLGEETWEELIQMTENTNKKTGRRPLRAALVAVAAVVALCVTAFAAVPEVREAVTRFFTADITVVIEQEDGAMAVMTLPDISLREEDGRSILVVDGEETDVTEARQKGEDYVHHIDYDDSSADVTLHPDGSCSVLMLNADGEPILDWSGLGEADPDGSTRYQVTLADGDAEITEVTSVVITVPADQNIETAAETGIETNIDAAQNIETNVEVTVSAAAD